MTLYTHIGYFSRFAESIFSHNTKCDHNLMEVLQHFDVFLIIIF